MHRRSTVSSRGTTWVNALFYLWQCLIGIKCNYANGHMPKGKRKTAAWLLAKLNESPNKAPQDPDKIMTREHSNGR